MEAVVEYDYEAEQEDELSLKAGDVIKNVVTAEGGWWEGELGGKKGMFPDNFVKLRTKGSQKEGKREAPQRKSVRELANKFKDGVPMPGTQAPAMQKRKEPAKMKKCKVMFDYKAENEDELSLTTGQILDFIKEVEEGWWEGSLDGKTGVFPSNFVEMMEEGGGGEGGQPAEGNKPAGGEGDAEFQEIKGKKVVGIGLGNIFQGGPIQLRSTTKKPKPDEKDGREPKVPPTNPPDVSKREKHTPAERAVARYSYSAEQPDELSLKEGDIVRVVDKHLEDEGWWRGELNGKTGVFPDNFVELLPMQEEPFKAPKKPPPPVAKNIYPKLPEKVPSVEEKSPVVKKEPEMDKPAPAGSVKKPMFPPPVGRKPGLPQKAAEPPSKPEPPKPAEPAAKVEMRHRDPPGNHLVGSSESNHVEEKEESNLDAVETSSHKLVHLTASRAKAPKTRPPSTVVFPADMDKGGPDADDVVKGTNHVHPQKPPPPVAKEARHIPSPEMDRSHRQPSPHDSSVNHPSRETHEPQGPHAVSAPPRPPEPSRHRDSPAPDTSALSRLVEELQREVRELRGQTVSRNDYNDLRSDHQRLKAEFDSFKATQSKKLVDLMLEVDEEKKLRLNTQVEMERVKRLLAESHV